MRRAMELEQIETFQNAFFWRGRLNPDEASCGVAGLANSNTAMGARSGTLIRFRYREEQLAPEQLLFVNIIAFYLHVYLVQRSESLALRSTQRVLTAKEKAVLKWAVGGKTCWEVGRILSISERTVKFHLHNIYAKLNVANRTQAVIAAARLRLL